MANPSDLKQITVSVFGQMNPSQEARNGPVKLGLVLCCLTRIPYLRALLHPTFEYAPLLNNTCGY